MADDGDKGLALLTHYLLRAGVAASGACMAAGLIAPALGREGEGLIRCGVAVLVTTPVARVVLSAAAFARAKDWAFCLISLSVLGLMALGLLL